MSNSKKKASSSQRRAPKAVVLPDDACPECGAAMRKKRGKLKLPVNGEEMAVPKAAHLACPKCREIVLRLDDARRLREQAHALYRDRHSLLSGEEIRAIRERFGLTQGALAELLRLGGNTISRWEAGRNVQTASMDVLLRMVRDLPGTIEYLRSTAA